MTSLAIAVLVFACTFFGARLGMRLRASLPEHHLSEASKDVVRLCMGLIATLTALILGLVTASAKSAFDAQDAAVKLGAANVVTLDRTLLRYGPETKPIRASIREAVAGAVAAIWSTSPAAERKRDAAERTAYVEQIEQAILDLAPQSDTQRWLQSQALGLAADVLKTRWQSFTSAGAAIPTAFLIVIVFWLTVLFWSFGLFAPRNAMVTGVLLLSALSVAASVFLILEMQSPFEGVMQISNAPLLYAISQLGP